LFDLTKEFGLFSANSKIISNSWSNVIIFLTFLLCHLKTFASTV
jgi:hypothetical protein